jgi:molybdate transport system substrate-binding protein
MNHRISFRLVALAAAASVSLGAQAADLTVSGAASLTNAFQALKPLFEAENPGTTVLFNFAASDALLAQISKGAPVDVFAAADQDSMDRADAQKLLAPGSRHDFVGNSLVVIYPADSAAPPKALTDLKGDAFKRIALGTPSGVPAGRYAKGALEAAGLWSAVEPKAVYAQSVRQSLDYVSRGEVDAGFVYGTDALVAKDKVKVAFTVPTQAPIRYPIATIAAAPNPQAAARFLAFVSSAPARAVFARFGFQKP